MRPVIRNQRGEVGAEALGGFVVLAFFILGFSGWITHIFWFFDAMTNHGGGVGPVLFFIVGLICFPIGVVHGWWLWFQ